ncbi:hypothetical protein Zmor_023099 [Zophobas morio]|uniref:Uncharacterized protein n=1 Tax=Zophobas morio TaxID=2755281 RepID=A0AA38M700_9CUCU|nr:hypothetical protein Zmor_023099 [Zophobas morio]
MSLEKLATANIKNRAEYSNLSMALNRLEKEKQNELRMINTEIQRFKSKYSKSDFGTDSTEVFIHHIHTHACGHFAPNAQLGFQSTNYLHHNEEIDPRGRRRFAGRFCVDGRYRGGD